MRSWPERGQPVASVIVIRLDAATVLLQWAVGGMLFCWFTTRRREVGVGYGWLLRATYLGLVIGGLLAAWRSGWSAGRDIAAGLTALTISVALVISVVRRKAGVSGQQVEHDRRTERVAVMTGIERAGLGGAAGAPQDGPEFPPILDLIPVGIGMIGLVAAGFDAGGNAALAIVRTVVGAVFLGSVTDAMLLGHWYLVQPGLPRRLLNELVASLGWIWPAEVAVMLIPTGMVTVLNGGIDDGWGGILGWFWVACAITTIALVFVTRAALKERAYSAVMAATGLLYLAILTAFGTDLVARAVLAG